MEDSGAAGGIFLVLFVLGAYFFPFIVATIRRQPNNTAIFIINLLLGWTLIGWVVALVWAVKAKPQPTIIYQTAPPDAASPGEGGQGKA